MQDNLETLTDILQKDTETLQELVSVLRQYDRIREKLSEKTLMAVEELLQDVSLNDPCCLRIKLEELGIKGSLAYQWKRIVCVHDVEEFYPE